MQVVALRREVAARAVHCAAQSARSVSAAVTQQWLLGDAMANLVLSAVLLGLAAGVVVTVGSHDEEVREEGGARAR